MNARRAAQADASEPTEPNDDAARLEANVDAIIAACRRFPDQLALGIDAKGGMVATDGWLQTSSTSAIDLASQCGVEVAPTPITAALTDL